MIHKSMFVTALVMALGMYAGHKRLMGYALIMAGLIYVASLFEDNEIDTPGSRAMVGILNLGWWVSAAAAYVTAAMYLMR